MLCLLSAFPHRRLPWSVLHRPGFYLCPPFAVSFSIYLPRLFPRSHGFPPAVTMWPWHCPCPKVMWSPRGHVAAPGLLLPIKLGGPPALRANSPTCSLSSCLSLVSLSGHLDPPLWGTINIPPCPVVSGGGGGEELSAPLPFHLFPVCHLPRKPHPWGLSQPVFLWFLFFHGSRVSNQSCFSWSFCVFCFFLQGWGWNLGPHTCWASILPLSYTPFKWTVKNGFDWDKCRCRAL
jgi:hypothetical protein